ncbi:MAG: nucleotide exchange factor GrpE [Prevotellaceae bacterium]|nr:nucleotide exchange factor GrpE [Prevotellaceae bacterium]
MSKNKKKNSKQTSEQPIADEELNINAAEANEAADTDGNTNEENTEEQENSEPKTPEEQIAALEQQVADLKNAMLYKVAEFENYRKRTIKEKADLILNGGKKVMEALLPVADDLERAEANIEKATDVEALKEGLQLVFQKFTKTLEGLGLKKMEVVGEDFSTDYHEAIAFVPASDEQKGKVIDCVQNGYMLNEQVVRFAKVAVGQ